MLYVLAVVVSCLALTNSQVALVTVDSTNYVHEAKEEFLSIALDCTLIGRNWKTFNFTDQRVISMLAGLSPAILRLGGTSCDYVIFDQTTKEKMAQLKLLKDYDKFGSILKTTDWDKLVKLAHTANMTLLFDANVMLRKSSGEWDPTNFVKFLSFNSRNNNSRLMFELGNEPNNYPSHFNRTITGQQLAADFQTMKNLIRQVPMYKDSMIVGADVGNPYIHHHGDAELRLKLDPATLIHDFFKSGHKAIDALTWHQYYLKGSTATVHDFINATVMDTFKKQVDIVKSIVHSVLGPNSSFPLWMGETSSAYDSGAKNLSNTYVAGFLWLDKLGVSAQSGYDVVIRQTFYDGYYSLIDHDLNPQPDYWLSLLYKRLVGRRSLNVTVSQGDVRVYASCTSPKYAEKQGAVTLYAMNLNLVIPIRIQTSLNSSHILAYNLEPTDGTLNSPLVNNNGKPLLLDGHYLPAILPRWTDQIELKPLTFGFFVMVDANATACL